MQEIPVKAENIIFCSEELIGRMFLRNKERISDKIDTTFHGWGKDSEKIDYIFVTESLKNGVKAVYIWDYCDNGIYLSDNYPVCAEIDI